MDTRDGRRVVLDAMKRAIAAFNRNVAQGKYPLGQMAMQYYVLMHACNGVKESFNMERKK